jgi:type IV pilus assembly protein PilV
MDNMRQAQSGFTLIELLIAIVILTVGILGTAALTTAIIHGNFFSKNITSATALAQSQLEEVQRAGYANVNTSQFPASAQVVSVGGFNFSRTTTITDNSPATNVKTVTVTVNWTEANNAARSITLQTLLSTASVQSTGGEGCDDDDDDCNDV